MKFNKFALLPLFVSLPLMAATPAPHWTADDIVLMTDFCHGDPAAVSIIEKYCRENGENGCSDNDKVVADRYCSELEAEEQAATADLPPQEDEPPLPAQPTPPPYWSPEDIVVMTDFCHGDPAAVTAVQNHCNEYGCSDHNKAVRDRFCSELEAYELADAGQQPPPEPQPVPQPPPVDPQLPAQPTPAAHWTADDIVLMTDFCHGDPAAVSTIEKYCRENGENGCSDNDKVVADRYCSELEAYELADAGQQPPPQPEPVPQPPPVDPQLPAQPTPAAHWTAEDIVLMTDFCHGDPAAVSTIEKYCRENGENGCSDNDKVVADRYCSELEAYELADAGQQPPPQPEPEPEPQPEPEPLPPPIEDGEYSLMVSWDIPTERKDGQQLGASELSGYQIYVTSDANGDLPPITVDNPYATEHTISKLPAGTYDVALVSIDSDGIFSELSQVVSATISGS